MLEEAIEAKKSGKEIVHEEVKPNPSISKSSYIPNGFTNDDFDKLDMYQKLDKLASKEQLKAYRRYCIERDNCAILSRSEESNGNYILFFIFAAC